MRNWLVILGLAFALPAEARRKKKKVEHTFEERMEVFREVFAHLEKGNKTGAAEQLLVIVNDEEQEYYHVEAYSQLAGIFEELSLPYSSLLTYQKALSLDATRIPSAVEKSISLADQLGDGQVLEEIFASNVGIEVDAEIKSRMAYLAAREAFQRGDLGPAFGILQMVKETDPDFPEAQNLLGVIMTHQDREESALVPFQIAIKKGVELNKPAKFQDAVVMNIARAYFTAENFPQASVYYAQIPRDSVYWLDAHFERAWAHFRAKDMNGVLGLLHTHNSPFFEQEYYPEAELLRIYSLMMLCKFPEANQQIDLFVERFTPQQKLLDDISSRTGEELFTEIRSAVETGKSDLPEMITRRFVDEDRFLDALKSVKSAEDEANRLQNVAGNEFAKMASSLVEARKTAIIETEGKRIKTKIQTMADDLQEMLSSTDISKLDILDMETQMLERAAVTGELEEAKRQVKRSKRLKKGELVWPYEGEYWADEVGYYQVNTKSECPASLSE